MKKDRRALDRLEEKTIAVIGLGKSGFAAAKFLAAGRFKVKASDGCEKKEVLENASYLRGLGVEVETGRHSADFLAGADLLVTSPGVSKESLPMSWAKQHGVPIISEIDLASRFCKGKIVAVTGSNGKTTTCNLIHRMLTDAGKKSVLCGNVGYSFLDALPEIDSKTIVVLELSSFQLEDSPRLKPRIAAVLNVSPNHLDRHKTFENYAEAKEKILQNQKGSDVAVLNHDDTVTRGMGARAHGKVLFFGKTPSSGHVFENGRLLRRQGGHTRVLAEASELELRGEHNVMNALAALAVCDALGVSENSAVRSLKAFRTLEHRIEPLGEAGGVRFVNDSKSTTVASTTAAIRAMSEPIVLIAGGRDKGADFTSIAPLVLEKIKQVVLYGEARGKIAEAWAGHPALKEAQDFRDAVHAAYKSANAGDTLLLSPMCASFDQFSSFEQRGEAFKRLFEELQAAAASTSPYPAAAR